MVILSITQKRIWRVFFFFLVDKLFCNNVRQTIDINLYTKPLSNPLCLKTLGELPCGGGTPRLQEDAAAEGGSPRARLPGWNLSSLTGCETFGSG